MHLPDISSNESVARQSPRTDTALDDHDARLLQQLSRRQNVRLALERLSQQGSMSVQLCTVDDVPVFTAQPAHHTSALPEMFRAPLRFRERQIGFLTIHAASPCASLSAAFASTMLEEVLELEFDAVSLTQEVVRSYEELHLLYELGESLSGVMSVEIASALVVMAVLAPLNVQKASLFLRDHDEDRLVAQLSSPEVDQLDQALLARVSAPLYVNAQTIGLLVIEGVRDGQEFTSGDLKLLDGVAAVVAPALQAANLYESVRRQADTDGLTGISNHRRLQERIDEELERARRYEHPLSIIIVDIDNFKMFNDIYGHPVGDQVLQIVSESLCTSVRAADIIGRYGGDEFMLIMPETSSRGSIEVAERVLAAIGDREIVVNGERLPIAVSLGIASYPEDAVTKHELIAHADAALYESKRSGGRTARHMSGIRADWLTIQGTTFGVLEGLVHTVDAKDRYTREHSEVVTEAALILAQRLNLSEETRRALRIAGLLHDVGKIGIPDYVLKKPGHLTSEEFEIMKQHVKLSEMIIKGVPYLNDVLDAVAHHHERFDGQGYPYGKRELEIPLLGRIMAIADSYSAMCLDRPYRKALTWEEARRELERGAGTQFDPELVLQFIEAMEGFTSKPGDRPLSEE